MPTTHFRRTDYSGARLDPYYDDGKAREVAINMIAGEFSKGAPLAETATPGKFMAYDPADSEEVDNPADAPVLTTPVAGGAPTAFVAGDYTVRYTFKLATDQETDASPAATTTAAAGDAVHVDAITPPDDTTVCWYISVAPGSTQLVFALENDGSAVDLPRPAADARVISLEGNLDISLNGPTLILRYDCVVDAEGNIEIGYGDSTFPTVNKTVDAFRSGTFRCQDVSGLNAEILASLGGKLIMGNYEDGLFEF